MADKPRGTGLGSLPRPILRPGAGHAVLWMLFVAELMEYGLQPQLTTGEDVHPAPVSPVPPCTCRYGLHPTIWCPTHLIDVPGVGQRSAAWTFRIDPWCPHHAPVRVGGWEAFDDAPFVLDEQERKGD